MARRISKRALLRRTSDPSWTCFKGGTASYEVSSSYFSEHN